MTKARKQELREATRKCIATGVLLPPEQLLRFVLDPSGQVTLDLGAKLPGRGAWVLASRDAVLAAAAKGSLVRAFKSAGTVVLSVTPDVLADHAERGLEARALAAFGLARRAGAVVVGFEKVREALKRGVVGVLIAANGAAADGAEKLARLANGAPIVRAFSVVAQSSALGRDSVTHAAIMDGPEAARVMRELVRLDGFRPVFEHAPAREPTPA